MRVKAMMRGPRILGLVMLVATATACQATFVDKSSTSGAEAGVLDTLSSDAIQSDAAVADALASGPFGRGRMKGRGTYTGKGTVELVRLPSGAVELTFSSDFSAASVPGRTFVGKIAYIRDEVDRDTRAVRARIDVDNKDQKLKPGMYAAVQIADPHGLDGAATASQALAVSVSAIVQDKGSQFVFVEIEPGIYERRNVSLGRRSASVVEVLSGVERGENIVTAGTFYLKSEARKDAMAPVSQIPSCII